MTDHELERLKQIAEATATLQAFGIAVRTVQDALASPACKPESEAVGRRLLEEITKQRGLHLYTADPAWPMDHQVAANRAFRRQFDRLLAELLEAVDPSGPTPLEPGSPPGEA